MRELGFTVAGARAEPYAAVPTLAFRLHVDAGDVPLLFLFSGTVFAQRGEGLAVTPVSRSKEASDRLPVATWRETMDPYFPDGGRMRLRRESSSALMEVGARRALATFDDVVDHLVRHERSDA